MTEKPEFDIKLFQRWSFKDVAVNDLGLRRYISLKPVHVPHSGGRHEHHPFRKGEVPIVERFANDLMRPGVHGGAKVKALSIVRNTLEIVYLKTSRNPIEVLVRAIENAAPCEDVTRVAYGGIVYHRSVDISPSRRVDLALRFITEGSRKASKHNPKTIEECLADEVIAAANRDSKSYAVQRREEMERIALSSR